ncbi:MAG TPA: hypothetical protein VH062_01575 [Polyangiaceae bacterium]|jgi:hypothetical protein|nr:hypothetical protein [Polyangiaceae bacterium]
MNTLLIRSMIIGGLLAAGPALVLACDRERHESTTPNTSNVTNASNSGSGTSNGTKVTVKAARSSGVRWL